jgi:hypothetical protein
VDSIIGMGQPTLRAAHHVATIDWITDPCPTLPLLRMYRATGKTKYWMLRPNDDHFRIIGYWSHPHLVRVAVRTTQVRSTSVTRRIERDGSHDARHHNVTRAAIPAVLLS